MPLECSICLAADGKDGKVIDVVCHHGGKPLCQEHRVLILDEEFANQGAPVPRTAYHCPACHQSHHSRSHVLRTSRPVSAGRSLWPRLRKLLKLPWKRKARPKR